jgi:hypothetical protein
MLISSETSSDKVAMNATRLSGSRIDEAERAWVEVDRWTGLGSRFRSAFHSSSIKHGHFLF